ncbi:hypothetical protein NE237_029365 [Protea cynaroides]|uniref:Transmembrane protein n=1 Tax=Protea cynaroides TaxID=273540 RepID=A0A9Q0JW68_9MAGN|nr:hypothetical protein NE237_029365 [Protea cynaroides]
MKEKSRIKHCREQKHKKKKKMNKRVGKHTRLVFFSWFLPSVATVAALVFSAGPRPLSQLPFSFFSAVAAALLLSSSSLLFFFFSSSSSASSFFCSPQSQTLSLSRSSLTLPP